MLNRGLCANFVAAELPEHLLLVVVRLNAPAELVELERVNRHMLGAGVAEPFVLLPSNAYMQRHRIYGAEKETVRATLAQRHIGMDGMVAKDARFHQTVSNKIVVHPAKVIREIIGNLVQHQAFTVLWWTAATACRRIRQLEHGRIVACIAGHVEIRIAESMCEQLALGVCATARLHPNLYLGVPLVARGDCRTDPVGAWLPSRQRSDDLPRYPRRTAEPARGFSEVRTSETTASRETASQERQRRTSWQVRHIAPHRRASCQCSEPFRPWPLGSGYCGGQARKGMPHHTGGPEKPVLAWWKSHEQDRRCSQQGDV